MNSLQTAKVELDSSNLAMLIRVCENRIAACEFLLATDHDPKGIEIAEESRREMVDLMDKLTAALDSISDRIQRDRQAQLYRWRNHTLAS